MSANPIFFVGAPRSGTTITFEHFALHPDLAWITNYVRRYPKFEALNLVRRIADNSVVKIRGRKNQFGDAGWWNRFLPWPDESYRFWNGYGPDNFGPSCLHDQIATPEEQESLRSALDRIRRYQGRSRMTTKMTGPGRIGYLHSVWPAMYIVHVVRDGLDVTRSLLNTNFWKNNGGYESPWWDGIVGPEILERWVAAGSEPAALAALQWREMVGACRREGRELLGERYLELRYEDFLADSVGEIQRLHASVGLASGDCGLQPLERRNKTYDSDWTSAEKAALVEWMQPEYSEFGYCV